MPNPRQLLLSDLCQLHSAADERPPAVLSIDQDSVDACWKTLFSWNDSGKYKFFLLDLPHPISINQEMAVQYAHLIAAPGIPLPWTPPSLSASVPNAIVSVNIPATMRYNGAGFDRAQEYCIVLDGIAGAVVPEITAHVCSAAFAAGLVCRLALEQLVRNASTIPNFGVLPPMANKLQLPILTNRQNLVWAAFVDRTMQAAPFQVAGIFHGWAAGADLVSLTGQTGVACQQAIWNLLKGRFSWDEMGEITGYALNYIVGYLRCQDVLNDPTLRHPFTSDNVLKAIKADTMVRDVNKVQCDLYANLLNQLRAVGGVDLDAGKHFRQFLTGYHRGGLRAAEVIFADVLSLGYGIGYVDGFRVGYQRGYADGYRDGYDAGYPAFWRGTFQAIRDVAQIVAAVESLAAMFA